MTELKGAGRKRRTQVLDDFKKQKKLLVTKGGS
jgi:hypothetical protein